MSENPVAQCMRGIAALREALDLIGAGGSNDHALAGIICKNELELQALIHFTLRTLAAAQTTKLHDA